jgi:soluble lytic murein transglycosylase-like protein
MKTETLKIQTVGETFDSLEKRVGKNSKHICVGRRPETDLSNKKFLEANHLKAVDMLRQESLAEKQGHYRFFAMLVAILMVLSGMPGTGTAESEAPTEKTASSGSEGNSLQASVECQLDLCEADPRLYRSATKFTEIIADAAEEYGVEAELIRAIIHAESAFNPKAVSHRGARGLMQLMPATARSLGVRNRFDPEQNIMAGTRYFRQLLDRVDGKVKLALAAYNAGMRNVRKYGGVPPFPVTRKYVRNVMDYYDVFKHFSQPAVRQS